ncbi:DUF3515 family protein [Microcella humidisoli]|uniref:DUF3515 domain-containing protein n=1 Tax=Microcella humidisoli TaxID=2963406 RepID=A0ABY5FWZ9_9MICO|nr:DUF3515 family protein [Microcella humidisoli]UTT62835.1 DUF3515 domain-containing protein [Microcella humidisoli]
MSTRTAPPRARRASAALLATAVLGVTGCAGTVALEPGPESNALACAEVMVSLPDTVGTVALARRSTNAQSTAAWGDPTAVIYRCGLPEQGPSDLPCFDVDGVDWLLDESNAPRYVFTTYARTPVTEIIVDVTYIAGADAVRELSPFIAAKTTATARCLAATDVFGGGSVSPTAEPTPTPTP